MLRRNSPYIQSVSDRKCYSPWHSNRMHYSLNKNGFEVIGKAFFPMTLSPAPPSKPALETPSKLHPAACPSLLSPSCRADSPATGPGGFSLLSRGIDSSLFSRQRSHFAVLRYLKSVIVENLIFLIIYILGFQNHPQPGPTSVINLVQGDYCGHKEVVN